MLGHRALNAEDYLVIVKRRWWVILIPALILPVLGVIATFFVTPKYDSTSLLLIEQQKVSADVVRPLDIGGLQSRLDLITAKIESTSTLEPIITKYNLYASQHLPMEARIALLRTRDFKIAPIQGQISGGNGLPGFKIVFTADDPHTAQQVCSEIAGLFTQQNMLAKEEVSAGTTRFLQSQLDEQTRKLDDLDQKLAVFKAQHLGALPGDESSTSSILGSLSSRLDATSNQIQNMQQQKELMSLALQEAKRAEAPIGISAKAVDADQAQLDKLEIQLSDQLTHYSEDYPDVKATKREISDLKAKMAKAAAAPPAPAPAAPPRPDSTQVEQLQTRIRLIDQNIAQAEKDRVAIQGQMGAAQGRLQTSPAVEQQYQELTRDYQTENNIYQTLLAKLGAAQQSTSLENQQEGENFSVLDMANLPVEATFPKQSMFAAGGFGGGLVLGLLIVAFLEYRDTALSTERDVWAFTQLPTLAVIAYSDDVAEGRSSNAHPLRRLFGRKTPKELVAG